MSIPYDLDEITDIYFDYNLALAILLAEEGILFISMIKGNDIYDGEDTPTHLTTAIYVNASDIFAWAYSDQEPITKLEIKDLFLLWHHDKDYGVTKWVCKKRNKRPNYFIVQQMKSTNNWCDMMESLPE